MNIALKIIKCNDSLMWYNKRVGDIVTLARHPDSDPEVYWSRDNGGYLNIIRKTDAQVVDLDMDDEDT